MKLITGIDLKRVMGDSVRLYFAPLVGAVKQVRLELRRIDRKDARRLAEHPPSRGI